MLKASQQFPQNMCLAVRHEPGWFRQQGERPMKQITRERSERCLDNRTFHSIEHVSIVYEADSALDIVEGVSRVCTPRCLDSQKAEPCPCVYADTTVSEIGENALPSFTKFAPRFRVNNDVCAQRAVKLVVAVCDCIPEVCLDIETVDACYAQRRSEDLRSLRMCG